MANRDHTTLLAKLGAAYTLYSPRSRAIHETAKKYLIDGGSHQLRLTQPFPPRIVSASGGYLKDEDGHQILDFWQGHLGNLLGHNPPAITAVLSQAFEDGFGLQTGFTDRLQAEVAEILCKQTGSERVRFTTSGSLATMYAIMLARSFTGRDQMLKTGGGWHGAQPWGLKGVSFHDGDGKGFQMLDSEGIPAGLAGDVIITGFNYIEGLRESFREHGDRLACFIVEPFIGTGGLMPASREFIQTAHDLCRHHGALLIFDEVICGFRFRAGNLGAMYGVTPDLSVFGKIIGGGMPVAAVAGREDVLNLAGQDGGRRVKFSGGTFSAHPASMLAAKTMMQYAIDHEAEIYPRLAELGEKARRTMESAFLDEGIYTHCTGYGNDMVPGSSMAHLHFPYREDVRLERPEQLFDPAVCDVELSKKVLQLALLLEDVYLVHGHGAVATAHTNADMSVLESACRRAAHRIKSSL